MFRSQQGRPVLVRVFLRPPAAPDGAEQERARQHEGPAEDAVTGEEAAAILHRPAHIHFIFIVTADGSAS